MLPVLTPEEMGAVDAAAPQPLDVLVARAARAVAVEAVRMLGSAYGAHITVVAGTGTNGADGRCAAVDLTARGARCRVVDAAGAAEAIRGADLVIDALVGTGLRRPLAVDWQPTCPVLAVDIPSGVDGHTGEVPGEAIVADRTVTFAAWKPGLLLGRGPDHAGEVRLVDIGLDVGRPDLQLIVDDDAASWPERPRTSHKWQSAVWVVGGRPGMDGAVSLAGEAAARHGAGYVTLSTPGGQARGHREAVTVGLPREGWGDEVATSIHRHAATVLGPGLDPDTRADELDAVLATGTPCVLDAGAIDVVARAPRLVAGRPVVLTPHDGEFERLGGGAPGVDRVAAVRRLAHDLDAVVLLKGPTTIVAGPDGVARLVRSGDQRLATAGTGDVLSGIVAAGLALGLDPMDAASLGAHRHGALVDGLGPFPVASDLLRPPAGWDG